MVVSCLVDEAKRVGQIAVVFGPGKQIVGESLRWRCGRKEIGHGVLSDIALQFRFGSGLGFPSVCLP